MLDRIDHEGIDAVRDYSRTLDRWDPPSFRVGEDEIEAVTQTLRSGWLTTGPRAAELEARMREYLDAEHVLAVSSCTSALHL